MTERIVFHAIDQVGLGHLSRSIAIALAVRERAPGASILFAVEGSDHGLLAAAHLPAVPLPSFREPKQWRPWPEAEQRELASSLCAAVVGSTRPHLIMFDCFPNPDLVAAARSRRVPFALSLRGTKDDRAYFAWLAANYPDALRLIVAHDPGELDIPAALSERTRFVGRITRPMRLETRRGERHVLITGGGGGYPGTVDFYNAALAAFARCRREHPGISGTLVVGPLFVEWPGLLTVDGIRIVPFDPELPSALAGADLVVCQAGYNTIGEVIASGVAAVCVPAPRMADDQHLRARSAAARHPRIRVSAADPDALVEAMLSALREPPRERQPAAVADGAERAAAEILALVEPA